MVRLAFGLLACTLLACSSPNRGTVGTGPSDDASAETKVNSADGGSPDPGDASPGNTDDEVTFPNGSRTRKHVLNLVNAKAAAQLGDYLANSPDHLELSAQAFYELYPDEYDFLLFFTDHDLGTNIRGAFQPVRRPAIPGTGLSVPKARAEYYSPAHLRGVVGLDLTEDIPPILHELDHYWANFLSPTLGFGKDGTMDLGPHWGLTSVYGQLGGFDATTLSCATPAGAKPPNCTPLPNGKTRYLLRDFGSNANSFLNVNYAPLELYLMGLVPAGDVPSTFSVMLDGATDPTTNMGDGDGMMAVEASGIGEIKFSDIVARHGKRPLANKADTHFTSAFVIVSGKPVDDASLDKISLWADVIGNHVTHPAWQSFEAATGGRATLETRLGPPRAASEPFMKPTTVKKCDLLMQDCKSGTACYGVYEPACWTAGDSAIGESCDVDTDCKSGAFCAGTTRRRCAPYCNQSDGTSDVACKTLCPDHHSTAIDPKTNDEIVGLCFAGAGGLCDPLAPDCGKDRGCYGADVTTCSLAGTLTTDDPCVLDADCTPGGTCMRRNSSKNFYCEPYCDQVDTTAANGCLMLCPMGFWSYGDPQAGYGICIPPA